MRKSLLRLSTIRTTQYQLLIAYCIFTIRYIPLPKSATPTRIASNAQLYDFALDEADMAALDGLDKGKAGSISWNPVDFVDRA